jgi:hypothetical protein
MRSVLFCALFVATLLPRYVLASSISLMVEFAGSLFDGAAELDNASNVFPEIVQLAHGCDSWILEQWTVDEALDGTIERL